LGYELKDFGAFEFDPEDDYPDFMIPAAKALAEDIKNEVKEKKAKGKVRGKVKPKLKK